MIDGTRLAPSLSNFSTIYKLPRFEGYRPTPHDSCGNTFEGIVDQNQTNTLGLIKGSNPIHSKSLCLQSSRSLILGIPKLNQKYL